MKVRFYDPRDSDQRLEDPSTWKETDNPGLMTAKMAYEAYIVTNIELAPDFWEQVSKVANYCDEQVPLKRMHSKAFKNEEPPANSLAEGSKSSDDPTP